MISRRSCLLFLNMISYACLNDEKTCLLFIPEKVQIPQYYDLIPYEIMITTRIDHNNATIIFPNNSRILIRTPTVDPISFKGIDIHRYEELASLPEATKLVVKTQLRNLA